MRSIAAPFVVAAATGTRIQTRLRPNQQDAAVLELVGEHLGRLASRDVAHRCAVGAGPDGRTDRKRALTVESSSRWAGAITRTSNDQWQRGLHNLLDARAGLRRTIKAIEQRLTVPVGERRGRTRGYATQIVAAGTWRPAGGCPHLRRPPCNKRSPPESWRWT